MLFLDYSFTWRSCEKFWKFEHHTFGKFTKFNSYKIFRTDLLLTNNRVPQILSAGYHDAAPIYSATEQWAQGLPYWREYKSHSSISRTPNIALKVGPKLCTRL